MTKPLPKSVVFITGAFIGNNCWDEWIAYFEEQEYKCLAPAWPHKDGSAEELRNRHPDIDMATNRLASVTDHFAVIIKGLPEKPILIGHALGGLVVQLLLQRGLGAAGVAVHSYPPAGVGTFDLLFKRMIWNAMGFFTSVQKTHLVPFEIWEGVFANELSFEEQKEMYYKYCVPESKGIIRDIFRCTAKVDFERPHVPILFTSGSSDRFISDTLNYVNFKRYTNKNSMIGYKNFTNHNHLIFEYPECEEEASFILYWLQDMYLLSMNN